MNTANTKVVIFPREENTTRIVNSNWKVCKYEFKYLEAMFEYNNYEAEINNKIKNSKQIKTKRLY